jgi:hypothetical protein
MSELSDDAIIDIPCHCGHETPQTIGWLKSHKQFTCKGCNTLLTIDNSDFIAEVEEVDASITQLQRALSSINSQQ